MSRKKDVELENLETENVPLVSLRTQFGLSRATIRAFGSWLVIADFSSILIKSQDKKKLGGVFVFLSQGYTNTLSILNLLLKT